MILKRPNSLSSLLPAAFSPVRRPLALLVAVLVATAQVHGQETRLIGTPLAGSPADDNVTNLDIQSDFYDYDEALAIARATGNVEVTFGDIRIQADQVEFHQSSGRIMARDNVRVFRGSEVFDAQEVIYDTTTGEMTTSELRSGLEPIYYISDQIHRPGGEDGPIVLLDSVFTTHDSANPNYRFRVNKLVVHPGDKVVMHGAKLYAGDLPVFWFPFWVQPLQEGLGYYFTPGWNSAWGAFVLNEYGFLVGEDILAKAHFDVRSERGLAGGVEFDFPRFRSNSNIGRFNVYYAEDNNPQLRFNRVSNKGDVTSSRYRINLQHRLYFPGSEDETFYVDLDINRLSDEFIYQDFFPSEFRIDPQPDNMINIAKLFEQGEISLTGRFQLNEFFRTDTRSPELAVDFIRSPLADTGFFYDGFTSYGLIGEELDEASLVAGVIEPSGYNRFATYHEFLYPAQLGNWLNVVPRGGVGYANYSSFDVPGIDTFDRGIYHAGVDLSFKLSKSSPEVQNRALGIDGLLHVVRPYVNYSFTATDEINGRFTPIDRLTLSTRLRPIDMPLFTAVDDLRNWQVVRAGVSNRWFTKRNGRTHEWLSVNNYIEGYLQDPEFDRDFSNFFTDVEWSPLPWLRAETTAQLPLLNDVLDFSEISTRLRFLPTDWLEFGVGHYYLMDHPFFEDSNLYTLDTYTRLTDNWGVSTRHRFEADDSTLEYQQYSVHRDLASWTASVGAIVRDNRNGQEEFGILFSLTLKAFPKVSIPVDFQPGTLGAE